MKYKTTKRDTLRGYSTVIEVGYAQLQNLLAYREPVAYTAGIYGWNADIYQTDTRGVVICTGYRPFGGCKPSYELVRKYDRMADAVRRNGACSADIQRQLDNFLAAFVQEALAGNT